MGAGDAFLAPEERLQVDLWAAQGAFGSKHIGKGVKGLKNFEV